MRARGWLHYLAAAARAAGSRRPLREIASRAPEELAASYLDRQLRHAVANVPYYSSCGEAGIELASFPLLTRRLLRRNLEALHSPDAHSRRHTKVSTGGSTGEPVWVIRDREFRRWDRATDIYYLGAMLDTPFAHYQSRPRVILWHRRRRIRRRMLTNVMSRLLGQCTYIEPYDLVTEDVLLRYVDIINRARPIVIWAFAGPLYEVARFARRRNLRLHRPDFIISSVEMLYPHMREAIEQVFGCPVYNYYGAAEVGRVAAECTQGRFHVFTFNNHVEVLGPEDRPVPPGEEGRLVITQLHNRAMPLVRYDIGDLARLGEGRCPCGNPLPLLDGITGRVIEQFVTVDNQLVYGGYFVSLFYDHDWIAEFQVLQRDLDLISIYFKKMPDRAVPPQAFDRIDALIREVMGTACRVEWLEVEAIPRTPVGKHLHTRSLVWEARRDRDV